MSPSAATSIRLGVTRASPCCDGNSPELQGAKASGSVGPACGGAREGAGSSKESSEGRSSVEERTGLALWARALQARLAQIEAVRRRSDAISAPGPAPAPGKSAPARDSAPGVGPTPFAALSEEKLDVQAMSELELEKAAAERDFALRTLRVIAEPLSYRVLECCVAKECSTDDLVGELHLPGVAVWERVNDLIQVGLVQRDLDRAKVSVTPAGLALHGIVESVVALATEQGPMLDRGLTS